MLFKTTIVAYFQEFIVQQYSLGDLKHAGFNVETIDDVLCYPAQFLLPETKFYLQSSEKGFQSVSEARSDEGMYNVMVHSDCILLKGNSHVFHPMHLIDRLCRPEDIVTFPVIRNNEDYMLDPFKAKQIMRKRGLPAFAGEVRTQERELGIQKQLSIMDALKLCGTNQYSELEGNL